MQAPAHRPLAARLAQVQAKEAADVANAAKFTASGHIVVRVSVADEGAAAQPGSPPLHCEVQDTGPGLDRLPILAFTANAVADDHARCRAAGMVGVVTKPVNPEDLCSALLPWLVQQVVSAEAPAELSPPA